MKTVEVKFYFKFLKEAGVALDENNNPVEVYACIGMQVAEALDDDQMDEGQELFRAALARQVESNVENVIPITEEEYLKEAYEEDGVTIKPNVLYGTAAPEDDGPLGEFNKIAHLLPKEVREDIVNRINDWLDSGGARDDRYVINQVEYAKRVAKISETQE